MTSPYYSDALLDFYHGDVIETLRQLPDESVQCVVTSPPYWGLRDYGTATWVGGDDDCDHVESREFVNPKNTLGPNGHLPASNAANKMHQRQYRDICGKCGAKRIDNQIGLEPTPAEYVAKMVAVFDEVRRVLRDDGVVWLNLGSSYASKPFPELGIKHKDDCMIPARVAIALQEAGWYIRSEIVWAKKSPMPESVTDRPTSATEKIFLLTKSKTYFYDAEAVKVKASHRVIANGKLGAVGVSGRNDAPEVAMSHSKPDPNATRNLWNYWLLSPSPYPDAHFATFPPELPRTCILAGTSERGACPECGAPWRRVVEREGKTKRQVMYERGESDYFAANGNALNYAGGHSAPERTSTTTGWQPTCDCDAGDPVPCVVLDPFLGSGTTAYVAQRLGRKCVGVDLNADYLDMAVKRCAQKTLWGIAP